MTAEVQFDDHFVFDDTNSILWNGANRASIDVWLRGTWATEVVDGTLLLTRLGEELKVPLGHLLLWKPTDRFYTLSPDEFCGCTYSQTII